MSKKNNSYNFNFNEVIIFLYKNWKRLTIVVLLAAVLSYLISGPWFIKPKYKSVAAFYPGTVNSASYALFYSIKQKAYDPLEFANQEITERYMELLRSEELRSRIINKFNLMQHYKIDPASPKALRKLENKYDSHIKCTRTEYNSVKVEVLDEVPEKAAEIANGIMHTVDELKHEIQGRSAKQILAIIQKEYDNKLHFVDSIKTRLRELGAEGVYNPESQAKGLADAAASGRGTGIDKKLGEHGGEATLLNEMLVLEAENLVLLKTKYEQAKVDTSAELSNIFVISEAAPASDKASPRRSIVVLLSAISTFVLACLLIVGKDKYKSIKKMLNA